MNFPYFPSWGGSLFPGVGGALFLCMWRRDFKVQGRMQCKKNSYEKKHIRK